MPEMHSESSRTHGPDETLINKSLPYCSACSISKVGIYSSTMKSSPDSVSSLRRNVSSYQPGQAILYQDKPSEVFGSLRSGWAIAYRMLPGARRHIQGFMVPGDTIVLDLLHIGSNPISFGVSALTKATVCWFNAASIKGLLLGGGIQKAETEFWMAYYFGGLNHRAAMIGTPKLPADWPNSS